jgi:CRP/FNR family transcriptional regulator
MSRLGSAGIGAAAIGWGRTSVAEELERFLASILAETDNADLAARLRPLAMHLSCASGTSAGLPDSAAHYVWIARGNAKLVAHGASERRHVLEFHFAGDLVLVPARQSRGFTLEAIDACELVVFPATGLHEIARTDARLALALLERMTGALAQSREGMVTLGRKRAIERVAGFLLSIRARLGASSANGSAIMLPMSRRDIGDNLAITVESISREVGRLRKDCLIETPARARVCILDAKSLASRADIFAGAA